MTFVHKEEQHKVNKTPIIEELEPEELDMFEAEAPSQSLADTSMSEDVEVLDISRSSEADDEPDMEFLISSFFPVEGEQKPAPPKKKRRLVHDGGLSSPSPYVKKKSGLPSPVTEKIPIKLCENPFKEEPANDAAPKKRRRVIQESEDEDEEVGTQSQSQTQGSSTGKWKNVMCLA